MHRHDSPSGLNVGSSVDLSEATFLTNGHRQALPGNVNAAKTEFANGVIKALEKHATEIRVYEGYKEIRSYVDPNANRDLVCDIASCTKSITALAIFIAKDRGWLDLDQKVGEIIDTKEWKHFNFEPHNQITIRHLLTHTSGYPGNQFFRPGEHGGLNGDDQFTANVCDPLNYRAALWPLVYKVGEFFDYSNPGVQVLCEVLQKVLNTRDAGCSVEKFIQDEIFTPLKMTQTTLEKVGDTPKLYGGVKSTAEDLAKLGQMMLCCGNFEGARILTTDSVMEMISTPTAITKDHKDHLCRGHLWWKVLNPKAECIFASGDRQNLVIIFPRAEMLIIRTQKNGLERREGETDEDVKKRYVTWQDEQWKELIKVLEKYGEICGGLEFTEQLPHRLMACFTNSPGKL